MSEINPTPEELIEEVTLEVEDAGVIPMPIDPTLSHEGEAADAKATGDAIRGVIDNLKVNDKSPVENEITVYATDILMSDDTGAVSIAEALEGIGEKDASEIMYDSEHLVTIGDALNDIYETMDTELSEGQIDAIFDEVFGGDD